MPSSSSPRASRRGPPSSSWTIRRSKSGSPASRRSRARWAARSTPRPRVGLGLTDVLFGRKKLKKADEQRLFAITTARITLETDLGLKPTGDAAVIFKPLSAEEFVRAENELQELLDVAAKDSHSKIERRGDEFGYEWLIIRDNDFEELVATVHLVASELVARGFGEQLLAAAFKFSGY